MTTTAKTIAHLAATLDAVNITHASAAEIDAIHAREGNLLTVLDSYGTNGRNAVLLKGRNTGKLYAITARSSAIFMI